MDNNTLKEIKNRLQGLSTLETRLTALTRRLDEAKAEEAILLKAFEKEALDVEKIKKSSLSAMFFKFMGKYEDKIAKEEREELEAKLKYDKAQERIHVIKQDCEEIKEKIRELKKEKALYQEELGRRAQEIEKQLNTEKGRQYRGLEERQDALLRQQTEIKEALSMGRKVIQVIAAITSYLNSAEDWATFDVWSRGGIISHMMKYEHLDNAMRDYHRLTSLLQDFKKEVNDVGSLDVPLGMGIDSGTRSFDFWFDNIFTDLNVRDKIISDKAAIKALEYEVDSVMARLNNIYHETEQSISAVEVNKEEIMIGL